MPIPVETISGSYFTLKNLRKKYKFVDLGQDVSVHGVETCWKKVFLQFHLLTLMTLLFYIFMTTKHVFQNCYYLKAVENH